MKARIIATALFILTAATVTFFPTLAKSLQLETRRLDGSSAETLSFSTFPESTLQFAAPDPYACEIATMEACVLDGVVPVVPLARSREILQTVLALYKSAASGQPESPRHL